MADYRINVGADTTQFVKDVNVVSKNTTVKVKLDVDGKELQKISKETTIFADSQGNLSKNINTTTTSLEDNKSIITQTTSTMNKAEKQLNSTKTSTKNMTTAIDKSTKSNKSFASSFVDSTKKVFQFGLSTAVIGLFTGAVYSAWEEVKNLDSSITELKKVTDLGGESLNNYKQEAYDLASELKTSATNVTDAVTEFSKAGFTLQESMALGEQAIMFQTIADETLTASESATFLTQTLNGFNLEASEAERVISAVNEVSNNYSISSGDLSQNIGKVTAVANLANVSFEELIGLMTASNSVIQNSSKVANAYKSVLTNLINKDLEEQFNQFGLSQRDANGAMKDGYTQLKELSQVFNELGTSVDEDTGDLISMNDAMNALLEDIGGNCYMSHETD